VAGRQDTHGHGAQGEDPGEHGGAVDVGEAEIEHPQIWSVLLKES
jgi:hypothetical protein